MQKTHAFWVLLCLLSDEALVLTSALLGDTEVLQTSKCGALLSSTRG